MNLFSYQTQVQLYHTDATGAIFYGALFNLTHEALAAFLKSESFSILDRLRKQDFFLPVVHASANYLGRMEVEDALTIELKLKNMGQTSFEIEYRFMKNEEEVANASVVHVCIDKHQKKMNVDPSLLKLLNQD